MLESPRHSKKHRPSIAPIEEGITNDESEEHCINAPPQKRETTVPDENVTVERTIHPLKHSVGTIGTPEGTPIDLRAMQRQNADEPRDESFEPHSNVTIESQVHRAKQQRPIIETLDGMQIDDGLGGIGRRRKPGRETSLSEAPSGLNCITDTGTRIPAIATALRGKSAKPLT
jgi:hypothetical protein